MKIVIIGLGAAGFAAAMAIRKQNRQAEITFVDKKDFDLLHHCGLPFYIGGKIRDANSLAQNIDFKMMGIDKYSNSEAVRIDGNKKEIVVKNLKTQKIEKIKYDSLIIAAGAEPFVAPIPGAELAFTVDSIENAKKIKEKAKKGKTAVIIGAGAIGLETALALIENGLKVTVVDMLPNALAKLIDKDISEILEEYLMESGIELVFNVKITEIKKDRVLLEKKEIPADIVVMATGVRANTHLAKNSGISCGKTGITVNEKLETNIKDVYAAGDCIGGFSRLNKKAFSAQIATTATLQGTVAGINACGGNKNYDGVLGTFVSKIGEIEVAATGFNSSFAEQAGYKIITSKAKSKTKPEWFLDAVEITVKLIADETGKIIGAQAIGKEGAASRINVLSAVIKAGFGFKELAEIEFAYCPSISQAVDVVTIAAEVGMRKIKAG